MQLSLRWLLFALAMGALSPATAAGQRQRPAADALTAADSALVGDILRAEEGRDRRAAALETGLRHHDSRVRRLAARASARTADSAFATRDSLARPGLPPFPVWPEPAWKARYRALTPPTVGCEALVQALADPVTAVQLRAMDLAGSRPACGAHGPMVAALLKAVDARPRRGVALGSQSRGVLHLVHALGALARLAPDSARPRVVRHAAHPHALVRRAAARAAATLRDTMTLRALARDGDGNVLEAVLQGLSRTTGHADDSVSLRLLDADLPQVALAAAEALRGSAHPALAARSQVALAKYVARASDSERDVRLALLTLLGRPALDPLPPRVRPPLPPAAVSLALGAVRYLEVDMGSLGRFVVELRGDLAPIMAARILEHARRGGYDGQRWHRVEWDFVIQGGSPADNEYSGAPRFLVDELAAVPHPRGSVGMSTRGHDTGDAQWFINLRDNPRLQRDYTVFGVVVQGLDVVDGILEGDTILRMREVNAPARRGPP
jgi:cyclophilin family peptidyl-prolyl cis-trans isomerase